MTRSHQGGRGSVEGRKKDVRSFDVLISRVTHLHVISNASLRMKCHNTGTRIFHFTVSKHSLCPVSMSPFQNRNDDFTTFPDLLTSSSSRLTHTANLQFAPQYVSTRTKGGGGVMRIIYQAQDPFFYQEIIRWIFQLLYVLWN